MRFFDDELKKSKWFKNIKDVIENFPKNLDKEIDGVINSWLKNIEKIEDPSEDFQKKIERVEDLQDWFLLWIGIKSFIRKKILKKLLGKALGGPASTVFFAKDVLEFLDDRETRLMKREQRHYNWWAKSKYYNAAADYRGFWHFINKDYKPGFFDPITHLFQKGPTPTNTSNIFNIDYERS